MQFSPYMASPVVTPSPYLTEDGTAVEHMHETAEETFDFNVPYEAETATAVENEVADVEDTAAAEEQELSDLDIASAHLKELQDYLLRKNMGTVVMGTETLDECATVVDNFNNHIVDYLSVAEMPDAHRHAIADMLESHFEALEGILESAHLDDLCVAQEKLAQRFNYVVNTDHQSALAQQLSPPAVDTTESVATGEA